MIRNQILTSLLLTLVFLLVVNGAQNSDYEIAEKTPHVMALDT